MSTAFNTIQVTVEASYCFYEVWENKCDVELNWKNFQVYENLFKGHQGKDQTWVLYYKVTSGFFLIEKLPPLNRNLICKIVK